MNNRFADVAIWITAAVYAGFAVRLGGRPAALLEAFGIERSTPTLGRHPVTANGRLRRLTGVNPKQFERALAMDAPNHPLSSGKLFRVSASKDLCYNSRTVRSITRIDPAHTAVQLNIRHRDILSLIGNTPLIELKRIHSAPSARIFAKLETFNPTGTLKDRVALGMILDAIHRGLIPQNKREEFRLVEASSGSMGVSMAFLANRLGYRAHIVLREGIGIEKQTLIQMLAEVTVTSSHLGIRGSVEFAQRLANTTENTIYLNQFESDANWKTHFQTTGPELWRQMEKVDAICIGIGSGGTIRGIAEYLRTQNPILRVIGVVPRGSALSNCPGDRSLSKIRGIGNDFAPSMLNELQIDELITVTDDEASEMRSKAARLEGLLIGINSAAVLFAASTAAKRQSVSYRIGTIITDEGLG